MFSSVGFFDFHIDECIDAAVLALLMGNAQELPTSHSASAVLFIAARMCYHKNTSCHIFCIQKWNEPFVFYVKLYTFCVTAIDFVGIFFYDEIVILISNKVNMRLISELTSLKAKPSKGGDAKL